MRLAVNLGMKVACQVIAFTWAACEGVGAVGYMTKLKERTSGSVSKGGMMNAFLRFIRGNEQLYV